MTDPGPATQQNAEHTRRMIDSFFNLLNGNQQFPQINARGFNLGTAPEQDKKPQNKKKKQPNKKLEALTKKAAEEKAKHLKTLQELKELRIQASIEKKKKQVEKRKSLLQKEEERLKSLMEKKKKKNKQ